MPTWLRLILALLCGASTTFAYAPFDFWPLALLTPALLLLLLAKLTPRQALGTGYAWGFGWLATGLNWLHVSIEQFGGMPLALSWLVYLLLVVYLAIYPALCAWLLVKLFPQGNGRLVAFAPLWLGCEWLRGTLLTGFPWLRLGYSQIDSPLSALAPILGINGVDLILTSVAAALAGLVLSRGQRLGSLVFLLVVSGGCLWLQQWHWVEESEQPPIRTALVQGNVPQALKWDPDQLLPTLRLYRELTERAGKVDLVIWPESAIPATERQVEPFLAEYDKVLKRNNQQLITGLIDYQYETRYYYNKMLALGSELPDYRYGETQSYLKHHLVPFGEFVPLESLLRPLGPLFNLPVASFNRGDRVQPNFTFGELKLLSAICYEILLSEQLRENFADTDFILTISNDAWFGDSIGPHQHLQIARMRALELGRPVIRATNNGITALINADGDITARIPQFQAEVLTGEVARMRGHTPFQLLGSVPAWGLALFALLLALWHRQQSTGSQRAMAQSLGG